MNTMTPESVPYERLARDFLEQAWRFRAEGEVLASWFICSKSGIQIVGTPFDDEVPDVKRRSAKVIADIIRRKHAFGVLFVCDVWLREIPPEANLGQELYQPPSQAFDAVEALTVQCWRADGPGFALIRRYRQRDDGTLEALGVDEIQPPTITDTFAAVINALRTQRTQRTQKGKRR